VAWRTISVPSVGGGINVAQNPLYIDPSQWSWGDGYIARNGVAEPLASFSLITLGSGYLPPGTHTVIGLVPNPFDYTTPVIVVSVVTASGFPHLWLVATSGTVTHVTWDAVGTQPIGSTSLGVTYGFLNKTLVMALGVGTGTYSLIKFTGGVTFSAINTPATALSATFVTSFKSTLVAASVQRANAAPDTGTARQFAWADINTTDTWDPAISNAADSGFLDDVGTGITGLSDIGQNTLALFTADGVHALTPTGGIPLFTRSALSTLGVPGTKYQGAGTIPAPALYGKMPTGTVVRAADNLYLLSGGGAQPIGANIFRYLVAEEIRVGTGLNVPGPYLWHKRLGLFIVTRPGASGNDPNRLFYYDPVTGAWSHRGVLGPELSSNATTMPFRNCYAIATTLVASGQGYHFFVNPAGDVYFDNPGATPFGGEYFDTKDFTIGDPPQSFHVNLVRVEWELMENVFSDQVQVFAAMRNSFGPVAIGSLGLDMQGLTFVSLGTVAGNVSDLPCNLSGKVVRFRFLNTSGSWTRIRGFSFRVTTGGDRPINTS
jgi:hypothetical protein